MAEKKRDLSARYPGDELVGARFGRLYVVANDGSNRHGKRVWKCKCDCGNMTSQTTGDLRGGRVVSCGCYNNERISGLKLSHGACVGGDIAPEYSVWSGMIKRCHNPNESAYRHYGGRGVFVCSEWRDSFAKFFEDMGPRPLGGTIDRINNDLGYFKDNCRWVSQAEQTRNQRRNIRITIGGETRCLAEWSRITGVSICAFKSRIKKGAPPELAITYKGVLTKNLLEKINAGHR